MFIKQSGFTLIELGLIIGVLAILVVVVINNFLPYQTRISLNQEANNVVNYLQQARAKAIAKEKNKSWGVYFENSASGDDFFKLYYTDSEYAEGTTAETIYLEFGAEFTSPSAGASSTIQFTKSSGTTTLTTITIGSGSVEKNITVNSEGRISLD